MFILCCVLGVFLYLALGLVTLVLLANWFTIKGNTTIVVISWPVWVFAGSILWLIAFL